MKQKASDTWNNKHYNDCLPIAFKKLSFQVMREDFKNNNPIEQWVEVFRIPLKVKLTSLDKSRINLQILMEVVEFESQNHLLFLSTLLVLYRLQSTIKQTNANLIYIIRIRHQRKQTRQHNRQAQTATYTYCFLCVEFSQA
ncbi:hypothetical protein T11_18457 [Trichinella zimbabwensis]|uniref:Uncharacterized protein n=1 Tax=Trichinella zimbabwensis TaxID=268475 RepID=A0A0V1I171_9BILA|nr:hypothetical protein T11_18457 [Trichinella zimbabwensis]